MLSNAQPFWSKWSIVVFNLLALALTAPAFGQDWARNDGSIPAVHDWSDKRLVYTAGYTKEQFKEMMKDPRAFASLLEHGDSNATGLVRGNANPSIRANIDANRFLESHAGFRFPIERPRFPSDLHPISSASGLERDWAVSLGATAGVAAGMYPAKYSFDVNAAPNCTADYAVFPVNASTGNVRAHVVGTFTSAPTTGQTAAITITPTGGSPVTLTLTAGGANTGTTFATSATTATDATNLAAAINRNLSGNGLVEIAAVASGSAVTVYALTPGTRVVITDAENLTGFAWGAVTAGTNGAQANIVGFNNLYAGTTPFCSGATYPKYIFSYASGVGPVATSPEISMDGAKVAYVENRPQHGCNPSRIDAGLWLN